MACRSGVAGTDEDDVRGSLQEAVHEALQAAASCMDGSQHSLNQPEAQLTSSPSVQHGHQWSPDSTWDAPNKGGWGMRQRPQQAQPASPGPVAAMIQSLLQCQARVEVVFTGSRAHNVQLEGDAFHLEPGAQLMGAPQSKRIVVSEWYSNNNEHTQVIVAELAMYEEGGTIQHHVLLVTFCRSHQTQPGQSSTSCMKPCMVLIMLQLSKVGVCRLD